MATAHLHLRVKMPRWRMRACVIAAWIVSPFIRSEKAGERVGKAMLDWVKRGVRVYDGKRRIG